MQMTLSDRQVYAFRVVCMVVLFCGAAAYVVFTRHWQWMWDTQVMHYISFLIDHGRVPYRDIYDINMPGAYLTERWALRVFGGGDLGWRMYEYTLLGSMTVAMVVIAKPYDWLAGLFSGVLFTLLYGALGPFQAAERDEVMTALLFVGYAFLFTAVRKAWPLLMAPFGLAFGLAVLIKPTTLPFAVVLLVMPLVVQRRQGRSAAIYLGLALVGFALALGLLLQMLLPGHAVGPFLFILRKLVPYYASLAHPGWGVLIRRSLPKTVVLYAAAAAVLAWTNSRRANWEMWAIRLGFVFGALSYFVQRKGYDYHRISYLCFGLLWIGLEFTAALKDRGWRRNLGVAGMGFAVLLMVPFNARKVRAMQDTNPAAFVLEDDLRRLGGEALQGRVQCLDLVGGCYSALFRMGLVQSTGFTGDLQFFGPNDGSVVPYYRKIFWDDIHRAPPQVIVLSNEWYQDSRYSFGKLDTWPEFRDYLSTAYRLDRTEGVFPLYGYPMMYRVYVLKR